MARIMRPADVIGMAVEHFPAFLRQRDHAIEMDAWHSPNWQDDHEREKRGAFVPKRHQVSEEYTDLSERSHTPWLMLVIDSLVQTLFLDGVRRGNEAQNIESWLSWQQNNMDSRQIPLYDAAFRHGVSYASALPGVLGITREKAPVIRTHSARNTAAFFNDDDEEFPQLAMKAERTWVNIAGGQEPGWDVRILDEEATHYLLCRGDGFDASDWEYVTFEEHNLGFVPMVAYVNRQILDGRAIGEIEPFVPLTRRITQDTFDRLIVQRFGAWKVRYIAGLARPAEGTDEVAEKMRLAVEEILVSTNPATKFGTLDASDIKQFIEAHDADLRDLSATSQMPPYQMLGLSSNLQAESMQAAASSLERKSLQRRITFGESHERLLRVSALIRGNRAEAGAYDLQVRWRNMDPIPLSQAADALGKLATQVNVPQQMLFEMMPNWTDTDVARAMKLVQSGAIDALLAELQAQSGTRGLNLIGAS